MTNVLVTGANGRTGRPVVEALAKRGASVRVFLRSDEQWPILQNLGASESAIGDLENPASLKEAAHGCDVVIHIGPPMHPNEVEITRSLIDAANASCVSHFVYYSVMHTLRREVRHHRLKLDAEEMLVESGLPYTILQPARYMQHLEAMWPKLLETGIHAMPFNTEVKFNVVDLVDLAEAAAIIATNPKVHAYAIYELAGPEALSQSDMAEIIARALARPITAKQISLDDLKAKAQNAGASDDRIEQMQIMNEHYDKYGFLGNPNVLQWILGRSPTPFHQYVERLVQKAN